LDTLLLFIKEGSLGKKQKLNKVSRDTYSVLGFTRNLCLAFEV